MTGTRERGEEIRKFILDNIEKHPKNLATFTATEFGISRQAVNKHISRLVEQRQLDVSGATRSRHYSLRPLVKWQKTYLLDGSLDEDAVWRKDIYPLLQHLSSNVVIIWQYGVTEMLNNAIDHSSGTEVVVTFEQTSLSTTVNVIDNGEGIFRKIQRALDLLDERHAVLELAKGKLTTDPTNHTGEGIFFSSRVFDVFEILSGGIYFAHSSVSEDDWIISREQPSTGTLVNMQIANDSPRTLKQVFDSFTSGGDYGFTKTIVPVRLAKYGDEMLISRSQGKRLVASLNKFKTVLFDFEGVESIGQAFADEVFRVFQNQHPYIELLPIRASEDVQGIIHWVKSRNSQEYK